MLLDYLGTRRKPAPAPAPSPSGSGGGAAGHKGRLPPNVFHVHAAPAPRRGFARRRRRAWIALFAAGAITESELVLFLAANAAGGKQ